MPSTQIAYFILKFEYSYCLYIAYFNNVNYTLLMKEVSILTFLINQTKCNSLFLRLFLHEWILLKFWILSAGLQLLHRPYCLKILSPVLALLIFPQNLSTIAYKSIAYCSDWVYLFIGQSYPHAVDGAPVHHHHHRRDHVQRHRSRVRLLPGDHFYTKSTKSVHKTSWEWPDLYKTY